MSADAATLLGRRQADLPDDGGQPLHRVDDVLHRPIGLPHHLHAGIDTLDAAGDQLANLACRSRAALRQGADLSSHHRKATPCLSGAGGLHRSVQRQDVGLEGDGIDGGDDVGHAGAGAVNVLHGADHAADHGSTLASHFSGGLRQVVGLTRRGGGVAHRAGEFFHGTGRALQVGRRLFGPVAEIGIAGRDLRSSHLDAVRRFPHLPHRATQRLDHVAQIGQQAARGCRGRNRNQAALRHL
jgi:hypothetical protein